MLLIFDLDGTLTDPKEGITGSVQYALRSFGIDEELDQLTPFIGPPLIDSFRNFYGFDEEKARQAVNKYRERFSKIGMYENKVYPKIFEMLKILKEKGLRLAVGSSKPEIYVKQILRYFDLEKYFDVIVGSCLDGSRVDKYEIIQEVWKRLGKDKNTIMIGDRIFDRDGARKAKVSFIGVKYGYAQKGELDDVKYLADDVEELTEILLKKVENENKK
ncbi:HAD hydrolase, family IA [Firmicutes bacterium M10-2]|nr:HAD hydrolase, family IA [Firmicutes bacterium M10-2]